MIFGSFFFTASQPAWVMALVSLACLLGGILVFSYRQRLKRDDGFLVITSYIIREWLLDTMDKNRALVVMAGTHGSGMKVFRQITQRANDEFGAEAVEGVKAVMRIMTVFIMVSIFWALFDSARIFLDSSSRNDELKSKLAFLGFYYYAAFPNSLAKSHNRHDFNTALGLYNRACFTTRWYYYDATEKNVIRNGFGFYKLCSSCTFTSSDRR